MSNKPKDKSKTKKATQVAAPQQRKLFRPQESLPITRLELSDLYEGVSQARNARIGVVNVFGEDGNVTEGQGVGGLDLDLERLFVHVKKVYNAVVTSENDKPEDVLSITGEEFLTIHLQITRVRNVRTVVLKVPYNGQILEGQGMSPQNFDIEELSMYAEYVYERFLSLGFGADRETLMKELGLNEVEGEAELAEVIEEK